MATDPAIEAAAIAIYAEFIRQGAGGVVGGAVNVGGGLRSYVG